MRGYTAEAKTIFNRSNQENRDALKLMAIANDLRSCMRMHEKASSTTDALGREAPAARGDRLYALRMAVLHLHEAQAVLRQPSLRQTAGKDREEGEDNLLHQLDTLNSALKRANKQLKQMLRKIRNAAGGHYSGLNDAYEAGAFEHGLVGIYDYDEFLNHHEFVDRGWWHVVGTEMREAFGGASEEEILERALRAIAELQIKICRIASRILGLLILMHREQRSG